MYYCCMFESENKGIIQVFNNSELTELGLFNTAIKLGSEISPFTLFLNSVGNVGNIKKSFRFPVITQT